MPTIDTLRPVVRQQGAVIPNLLPVARWIDSLSLAATVAESYTLPSDNSQTPPAKGAILGITATDGPLYGNFAGTAAVPVADVVNGTSSFMMRTDAGASYLLDVPAGATSLSVICPNACLVTIEVWR